MGDLNLTVNFNTDIKIFIAKFEQAQSALSNFEDKVYQGNKKLKDFGNNMADIGKKMTSGITLPAMKLAESLVITGAGYKAANQEAQQALAEMKTAWGEASGAIISDELFAKMIEGVNKVTDVIGQLPPLLAPIVDQIGGIFMKIVDGVFTLVDAFFNLSPSTQQLILSIAAIAAAAGPALVFLGTFLSKLQSIGPVIALLTSPVGLIIAGIAALGIAFATAMVKSEDFRNIVFGAFESIKELVSGFVAGFMSGFEGANGQVRTLSSLFLGFNPIVKILMIALSEFGPQIASGFSEIASMIMPLLTLLGESLGQLAAAIIPMVIDVMTMLVPVIMQLGMTLMEVVLAALPIVLEVFMQLVPVVMSLIEIVVGLVSQIMPLVTVLIDMLIPVFMMLVDTILTIVTAVAPALIAIIAAVIAIFQAIMPVLMAIVVTVVQVMANIIAAITPIIAFVTGIISSIFSVIAPIVTFIAGIITTIFSVIQPITTFISGIFTTVFSIVSSIFRGIMEFITSAITTISSVIARLSGTVSTVFNTISGTVSRIMSTVSSTIQGVFTAITNSWNGLKSFVSGVFSGIGNSMERLVNRVKGFVNGVIGGINVAIGLINKIPGVSIGKIPQLYRGTDDWAGGFARMNEGGRGELVMLPSGSQVIPHDVSMRYAREAGKMGSRQSINIINPMGSHDFEPIPAEIPVILDGREIARATVEDITKYQNRSLSRKRRLPRGRYI